MKGFYKPHKSNGFSFNVLKVLEFDGNLINKPMKKLYSLSYSHIGGERHKQTDNLEQFSAWLDEAINDEYVTQGSIVITTETRK